MSFLKTITIAPQKGKVFPDASLFRDRHGNCKMSWRVIVPVKLFPQWQEMKPWLTPRHSPCHEDC